MGLPGGDTITEFVDEVAVGSGDRARRVALFSAVRDMPYATDAASDAVELVRRRRGNCLAKADLLWHGFRLMGDQVRRVRWRYALPRWPPEVARLPSPYDVHTAVELFAGGEWVLVDATYDPPLARGGLTVADWDGIHGTRPNCPPCGPMWREGVDDAAIEAALTDLTSRSRNTPIGVDDYLPSFNRWLDSLREGAPASVPVRG